MAGNRLFQMLFILLEKGGTTAPELAEHFEVPVRTIYRDVDILSSVGVPVYTTQGKGGGIFIEENFVLNKSLHTEQEQKKILLSLQGLSIVEEENTNELLLKLGGIFQKKNTSWIEVDFSEWSKKSEDIFRILKSAILQSKVIDFAYHSGKGQSENRSAEPLKLVFKSGAWNLYAYCRTRQDYRLFKLNRMKSLLITRHDYVRAAPEKVIDDMNLYADGTVTLSLLFTRDMAYRVYENFDAVLENADGSYSVNIDLPDNESLYRFLLSFGDSVEVLAPTQVREKMITKITAMKNRYET
ncbi:MAG TPA: YafY family transcriptional regulator [Clostridiales bacterium]|nr:YafY family transcriptional regulator [Clostridiales bacterium]